MLRAGLSLGLVVLVLFGGTTAAAQRDINVERLRPTLDRFGFIGIQGSATPGHKRWNLGFWTNYSLNPLRVRLNDGSRPTIIDNQLDADLFFEVGLFGRLAFAAELPFVMYQDGDASVLMDGQGTVTGAALADPRFTTKVRLLGKRTDVYQDRADGPGMGLLFRLPVPVGNENLFASENQFTFDLELLGDFHILGTGGGVMLGWRFRGEERSIGADELGQELLYGFAMKAVIPPVKDLYVLMEMRGSTSFRGRDTNTLEGDLGLRYTFDSVTLYGVVGTGFIRGIGSPTVRTVVGMSWSPKTKDIDGDGIEDARDECPRLAEDVDGFQDHDGCMDPDNDNDFVPDVDDLCPNEEAIEGRDEDEDGCTDPA